RTFHIGGTARLEESSKHEARQDGVIKYLELQTVKSRKGERIAMNRNGSLIIMDDRGREVARYQIVYGAHILVEDGSRVTQDQLLATWDPFTFAILTEVAGHIKFQDLKEGVTYDEEVDEVTGQSRMVVKDSPDEKKQPRMEIRNASNKILKTYQMPVRANLMVVDGETVEPGDVIAKIPRETTKTKDITGGLP
ncbi:MAG TPA: DNA-directed RNA polymerase subunit beta', partial [Blastocatellia bacterium]|nr:DNA-directed RNA polymerase subunit beta' [Blastocatellia bacterium]